MKTTYPVSPKEAFTVTILRKSNINSTLLIDNHINGVNISYFDKLNNSIYLREWVIPCEGREIHIPVRGLRHDDSALVST